jgi:glutathione S-transferase
MTADASEVLHLALRTDWEQARAAGAYTVSSRGLSLAEVGFVHASTPQQLPGVRQRFYCDLPDEALLVLHLDVAALAAAGSPLRWEPVGGELFPHVYGPVPVAAVRAVSPLRPAG